MVSGGLSGVELEPHLDAGVPGEIDWGREFCRADLEFAHIALGEEADELVAAYEANVRLVADGAVVRFVDSAGGVWRVPEQTVRVVTLNPAANSPAEPERFMTVFKVDMRRWLLFLDGLGRVVLRFPNYGWLRSELQAWVAGCGWRLEWTREYYRAELVQLDEAFPAYSYAPTVLVGKPFEVAEGLGGEVRSWFADG